MQVRRIPGWTPDDALEHKAIKGQKKGVRRFQYANGTYTKEGNERYRPKKNIVTRLTGMKVTEEGLLLAGIGATVVGTILLSGAVTLPTIGAATSAVSTGVGQSAVAALMANETFKNMVLPAIGAMSITNVIDRLLDDELDHSDIDEWLEHHGIKGQKWGIRHGPPYPLNTGYGSSNTSSTSNNTKTTGAELTKLSRKDLSEINDIKCITYEERKNANRINNCSNCSAAIDLRMRGMDVIAQPRETGININKLSTWYKNAPKVKSVSQDKVESTLDSYGKGARSYVGLVGHTISGIQYKHLIMYVNEGGKPRYYDSQTRLVCNSFDEVKKTYKMDSDSYVKLLRVDDLQPNLSAMKKDNVYKKR